MIRAFLIAVVGFYLCLSGTTYAHEINPGYLEIEELSTPKSSAGAIDEFKYNLIWKTPIRLGTPLAVSPVFVENCSRAAKSERRNTGTAILARYQLSCTESLRGSTITFQGLEATLTDVIVRFQPTIGRLQTLRASPNTPSVEIAINPSRWDVAKTYFILGVEHIWFGFDHLLFVLGLVLLIQGARRIIETITAFTLAHSVTLIATTLGWVSLPIEPVEAIIALSIVFLAIEIASKRPNELRFTERFPWIVATAFGLLHGFGFASALSNIGMPERDIPTALLTFNLGVEAGQLAFVVALLIVLFLLTKLQARRLTEVTSSYVIGSISMFWLIQRVL